MKIISFVLIAILGACGIGHADIEIYEAVDYHEHSYLFCLDRDGVTWHEAYEYAKQLDCKQLIDCPEGYGAHLVTINNADENKFLYDCIKDIDDYWTMQSWGSGIGPWIGLRYYDKYVGWLWEGPSESSYKNWVPGEPNDPENENYVAFAGHGTLKGSHWDDIPNDAMSTSFILEIEELPVIQKVTQKKDYPLLKEGTYDPNTKRYVWYKGPK